MTFTILIITLFFTSCSTPGYYTGVVQKEEKSFSCVKKKFSETNTC